MVDRPQFLDLLTGEKKFAELLTGHNIGDVTAGVKFDEARMVKILMTPGGQDVMAALSELIKEGKFKLPIAVKVVGTGLESIGKGLEELSAGVSGTKLVIVL